MKSNCVAVVLLAGCVNFTAHAAAPTFDVSELDASANACQDLDRYVNAKWIAANPIPGDRTRWGAFDQLADRSLAAQRAIVERLAATVDATPVGAPGGASAGTVSPSGASSAVAGPATASIEQQLGRFWRSGMDQGAIDRAGLTPIEATLDRITALRTGKDVAGYLSAASARGDDIVFGFGSSADFRNAAVRIGYANQGGLGLPTPDYYAKPEFAALREKYVAHIAATLRLGGASAQTAAADAAKVMAMETRLAGASLSPVAMRSPENQYHRVTVAQADAATPHFSWIEFLAAQGLPAADFSLSQPTFFAEFDAMLAGTPVCDWRAYLRFHAIDDAAPFLAAPFEEEHFAFYRQTLNGQMAQQPRWKRVLSTIDSSDTGMGMALGQLYVQAYFTPQAQARAEELVDNLRQALKLHIERLTWMGPETKARALAKWATFLPKIGHPQTWRSWSGLAIGSEGYYANVAAARAFNHAEDLRKIGKPTDRQAWEMTPQTVNAYYNPTDNTVNFPAAILQPPFFDATADDALNYGGIGAVIGHEMSHGYDDEGSQFDAHGNNANWWTSADRAAFDARATRLVDQFSAYEALPGHTVNGQLTLGENIADLGGLGLAYDALQTALARNPSEATAKIDGYTENQRFFLNWARVWRSSILPKAQLTRLNTDPHAPSRFRAIGAPSNMPQFADAFGCKAPDAMVRMGDARIDLW